MTLAEHISELLATVYDLYLDNPDLYPDPETSLVAVYINAKG